MSSRKHAAGFTLIEVLAALVVLAVVLAVVFRIFSGGLMAVDRTERTARALTLAQSELAAILAMDATPVGEREAGAGDLRALITVQPANPVAAEGLVALEVSVRVEGTPVILRTLKVERAR